MKKTFEEVKAEYKAAKAALLAAALEDDDVYEAAVATFKAARAAYETKTAAKAK